MTNVMNQAWGKYFGWAMGGLLALVFCLSAPAAPAEISEQDEAFLREVVAQSWDFLDAVRAPQTGFPTDSQNPGGHTNTTNIGLYLACLGPAAQMGLIDHGQAQERAAKIVASLGKIKHCRGFFSNSLDVEGSIEITPGISAFSDFNKLATGLILVRQFFPELEPGVSALLDRVEWGWMYDPETRLTHYGFEPDKGELVGPGHFWLASDCRSVLFFMVASGAVPPSVWDESTQQPIQADGLTFYAPGLEYGGLFMQAMDALFLDERGAQMGRSIGDLAWFQVREARRRNLPVWGWSNCNVPRNGYTEGGFIPWWCVTPHASALVIEYYPRHVVENLKKLDAMGLREPWQGHAYGFRDSVDLRSGTIDDRYLSLDQAMIFLALTNYLEDGLVRHAFAKDPLVARGYERLGERLACDPAQLERWAQRDATEPELVTEAEAGAGAPLPVNILTADGTKVWVNCTGTGCTASAELTTGGLTIDYDLGDENAGQVEVVLELEPVDARGLGEIRVKGYGEQNTGPVRLYMRDDQRQTQYAWMHGFGPQSHTSTIGADQCLGLLARPQAVRTLIIDLWGKPWYYASVRTQAPRGHIIVEEISLLPSSSVTP